MAFTKMRWAEELIISMNDKEIERVLNSSDGAVLNRTK